MKKNKTHLSMVMKAVWILSIAFVAYLSLVPKIEFPIKAAGIDKVFHALAYLWLAAIPFLGFRRLRMAFVAASLMIPLGITLEYVQRLMAMGRFFEIGDMIANTIGVLVGVALGMLFKARLSSVGFQE